MDRNSLKRVLEKKQQGPIDRYMHEKDLSEKYGTDGIKIYLLVDGQKTAEDIMNEIGMEEGRFIELISYMEQNDMVASGEAVYTPEEVLPAKPNEETLPEKPKEELPQEKPKEEFPPEKPKEEPPPVQFIKTEEFEFKAPKEEFPEKPKEEPPPLPLLKTEDFAVKDEKPPKQELPLEKPKEEQPSIPLLKAEGVIEADEKSSALKALVAAGKPEEELKPEAPRPKAYAKLRTPKTPMEKKLYNKFGDDGLYAYSMIDEFKTPREILKQTGMSEERLREIIEFMKQEGIIKLEMPIIAPVEPALEEKPKPAKPAPPPPKPVTPYRAPPVTVTLQPKPVPAQAKPAAPPAPPKPVVAQPEKPAPKAIKPFPFSKHEICVATAVPLKLVNKLRLEAELLRRYRNDGSKVLSLMNGKKVNVKIMKELKMSPVKFDEITSFLLDNSAIKVQCLTPESVRELYGDEGFSIYNKYGREGILLYEFIDKKSSLKDIVKMSGIDPRLAVEIFSFIHKVLGLDIPIDTELLYKQLGIRP
jgi:DNA-binding Lrp family transcriptional regulator